MRFVKVAVIQMACSEDHAENVDKAENLVREAAVQGANIILLPELFETRYFCKQQNPEFFEWKWIAIDNITNEVVDFKLHVYKKIQQELKKIIS